MDPLKKLFQKELIANIKNGTSPRSIKKKNKGCLFLDSSIVEHIKKSRLEKLNNEVNDEIVNQRDETDANKIKDQISKEIHANSNENEPKGRDDQYQAEVVFQATEVSKVSQVEDQNPNVFQVNEKEYFREEKKRKIVVNGKPMIIYFYL